MQYHPPKKTRNNPRGPFLVPTVCRKNDFRKNARVIFFLQAIFSR